MKYLLLGILLTSCTLSRPWQDSTKLQNNPQKKFTYTDASGTYHFKSDEKLSGKKLITRKKILSPRDKKVLESTVSVSRLGSIKSARNKNSKALLPEISQFRVWINKKEYFSQVKLLRQSRSLQVVSKGDEEKWNFKKNYSLPKGRFFCFFSQIPECLKLQNLLLLAARKELEIFVIWDNFPYHNELYEGMTSGPFVRGRLSLSQHNNKEVRYSVDIGNQVIFYHFDRKLNFTKMVWVSQGIVIQKSNGDGV